MKVKDFEKGSGGDVGGGYRRGDSWIQTSGTHSACDGKITVVGSGVGRDSRERMGPGALVRCGGCLFSWVIR